MVSKLVFVAVLLPAVANAAPRNIVTGGASSRGFALARQALPASSRTVAESRTIYLNPNGVTLWPGENDSSNDTSTLVTEPTEITGWPIDEETWAETVDCVRSIYSPFDVVVTDEDPGAIPHIEAVFGGSPTNIGLPDNVVGVSPFTTDCSVIERSVVFTFTDAIPDDARTMCEVMAQEIAHSYGLDHEMLPSDPMTYLAYFGNREFQDEMADCGEFDGRMCGIEGSVCRERQNSMRLLTERLGPNPDLPVAEDESESTSHPLAGACSAGGGGGLPIWLVLLVGHFVAARRARNRRHRALLQ